MTYPKLNRGTAFTIKSSGGDAVITPTSVTTGAGRISARLDLGAFPRTEWFEVVAIFKTASAATAGNQIRIYAIGADAATGQGSTAYTDGYFSESDAAVSDEDTLRNGKQIGTVQADDTTVFQVTLEFSHTRRYLQLGFWNASGQTLSGTATDCLFIVTPLYFEDV